MTNIQIIDAQQQQDNAQLIDSIYRLRNDTFKERLGWEVNCVNGREQDVFDELNVSHIAMTDNSNNVVGCWRALPTQGKYMLRNIFPELLRGEEVPEKENVWEISRFTVSKNFGADSSRLVSKSTAKLVKSFYEFARLKGISSYVLVTTVACERILRHLGVNFRRMGDGKSMKIGIERSVALWVDVNNNLDISLHQFNDVPQVA